MLDQTTEQATRKRLAEIERELSDLQEKRTALRARWQVEKDAIQRIQGLKAAIELSKTDAADFERRGDLGKVAEIRYGRMVQLEKELVEANEALRAAQKDGTMLKEQVGADDIAETISRWTGIPVSRMMETERTKLLKMEDRLHERVIGQEEAVRAVSNAIRRARAGLQDANRPIGSFIFLGTTGVGKTELARALAEFLFDDEQAMVRLDMTEYMEKHAVSRMIGAPPGYVGYDEGGQLTEAVRVHPYSVVLFDEIEKAHPDVFNVLLQVLDEGRLTDSKGREVNFRNTIIIMTSNIGTEIIQESLQHLDDRKSDFELEERLENVKEKVINLLKTRVRPEFFNRIDDVILFRPLSRKNVRQIAKVQIKRLEETMKNTELALDITDEALEWLAVHGYEINYGARPLKRLIQKRIADPLAIKVLSGEISSGDTVRVDMGMTGELEIGK
ncbi:MAG: AAA family ATPase [Candidatus Kapabacteria bacterium]|jgi:ATP-dependent Clp protease ATP-binding subunit ClpB|nr:AAA family ATPase [Candidatus Kapabacteria bacterium]